MNKLIDYRHAEPGRRSSAEERLFSEKKASHKNVFAGERCAIVTTVDVDHGVSRLHAARIEREQIRTMAFREIKAALEWLDVQGCDDESKLD